MFFGMFDGFFGYDDWGKAAEMALEMCLLEDMTEDDGETDFFWTDEIGDDDL